MSTNIEHLFVPYEESLELLELGFNVNGPYFGEYRQWDGSQPWLQLYQDLCEGSTDPADYEYTTEAKAPLFSQAFRFFRDKGFDVEIVIYHFHGKYVGKKFKYLIYKFDEDKIKNSADISDGEFEILLSMINPDNSQDSYEEAELACLRKLIQIVKDKQ